jgi:NAD+ synthase (glutamine-hydrolysing)
MPDARDGVAEIRQALLYGTRRFMDLCGVKRVVIGVSGGVDSSVAASLYRELLPPENLLLVSMPGPFTSSQTRRLTDELAANLDSLYAELPIHESVDLTRNRLHGLAVRNPSGTLERTLEVTEAVLENVQARDRSSRVLAAVASAFGGVFTCNANKSEATVGYTTLYGDLGGYFANLADLWKTEIYELARYLNRDVFRRNAIPEGTLSLVPSAELSPAQDVNEGKGDPLVYPYHDRLFASWVEAWNRVTPEEILEWYEAGTLETRIGYQGRVADVFPDARAFVSDLERWWGLYQGMGVAKRIQAPPILAIKRRAFGFDHRESQMGVRYTRRYQALKDALLSRAGRGVHR